MKSNADFFYKDETERGHVLGGPNAIELDGDIVPLTDVYQEAGAEWSVLEPDVPVSEFGAAALTAARLAELPSDELDTIDDNSRPEWQRDYFTYIRLGIGTFTPEEFQTFTARDRDMWQRVIRNYVDSLKSHLGRIRCAEGRVELDHRLITLYGAQRSADELLAYADSMERVVAAIEAAELIDHTLDRSMTRKKLKNAPDHETVHVVRDSSQKLRLVIAGVEKRIA